MKKFKPQTRVLLVEKESGENKYYPQYKLGFLGFWRNLFYSKKNNFYLNTYNFQADCYLVETDTLSEAENSLDHFVAFKNDELLKKQQNKIKKITIINEKI